MGWGRRLFANLHSTWVREEVLMHEMFSNVLGVPFCLRVCGDGRVDCTGDDNTL